MRRAERAANIALTDRANGVIKMQRGGAADPDAASRRSNGLQLLREYIASRAVRKNGVHSVSRASKRGMWLGQRPGVRPDENDQQVMAGDDRPIAARVV